MPLKMPITLHMKIHTKKKSKKFKRPAAAQRPLTSRNSPPRRKVIPYFEIKPKTDSKLNSPPITKQNLISRTKRENKPTPKPKSKSETRAYRGGT